jgi:cytochrome c oxidase assembly protein subunit 11
MPVVFVIHPDLPADLNTITLSYTFFRVEGPAKPSAAASEARETGRLAGS